MCDLFTVLKSKTFLKPNKQRGFVQSIHIYTIRIGKKAEDNGMSEEQ